MKRRNRVNEPLNQPEIHIDDVLKGAFAGLIGGIVATAVKSLAEEVFPPRPPDAVSPPVIAAQKVWGEERVEGREDAFEEAIHWTFGALTGSAYGALAEALPAASRGYGVPFGAVLFTLTHESALPLLGLEGGPTKVPLGRQANELTTHFFYGVAADLTRRGVRRLL